MAVWMAEKAEAGERDVMMMGLVGSGRRQFARCCCMEHDEAAKRKKNNFSPVSKRIERRRSQKLDCYRLIAAFISQLIIYYCTMRATLGR